MTESTQWWANGELGDGRLETAKLSIWAPRLAEARDHHEGDEANYEVPRAGRAERRRRGQRHSCSSNFDHNSFTSASRSRSRGRQLV